MVATINGVNVTVADIRKIIQEAPPELIKAFQSNPQQAIASVYLYRYLADDAKKAHLDEKSPYKEQIQEVVDQALQIALANADINNEHDGFPVTGDQIDAYYQQNLSRWQEAKIKIILIAFKPAASGAAAPDQTSDKGLETRARDVLEAAHPLNERSQEEAQKLAADLVKQLRQGADFSKLVAQYSDDAESKSSGGDFGLPIKSTSAFAPELKKAVFAMKTGDISDPVRQGNGFYIVKLEDMKSEALNDVRSTIITEMRNQHLQDYMKGLDAKFRPEIKEPEFFVQPGKYLSQPAAAPAK